MSIAIKRAYDAPKASDGFRVLVDRLWPRGLSKQTLKLDAWMRDLAPSTELRRWVHDDMSQWTEFKKRYFQELKAHADLVEELRRKAKAGAVTLIYAKRDEVRNNAAALKEYLERT
jgi:uncharacterized protein YeaO (DUF488 family)